MTEYHVEVNFVEEIGPYAPNLCYYVKDLQSFRDDLVLLSQLKHLKVTTIEIVIPSEPENQLPGPGNAQGFIESECKVVYKGVYVEGCF